MTEYTWVYIFIWNPSEKAKKKQGIHQTHLDTNLKDTEQQHETNLEDQSQNTSLKITSLYSLIVRQEYILSSSWIITNIK